MTFVIPTPLRDSVGCCKNPFVLLAFCGLPFGAGRDGGGIPLEGVWDLNGIGVRRRGATFYLLARLTNFDGRR
jgi:hypothetical protein